MTNAITVPKSPRQPYSDDQKEFLFQLRTTHTTLEEICSKFNLEFFDPTGEDPEKRTYRLNIKPLSSFFRGKNTRAEYAEYVQRSLYRIQELPFASPAARVMKLGEILQSPDTKTREKIEALKQIFSEQKYVEERLAQSRPEPIVLLKMEALDDEDPLLDTETFTKTKQLFLAMVEEYGEDVGRELKKLIKTFRDNGGYFEHEEPPKVIEAEIINGDS